MKFTFVAAGPFAGQNKRLGRHFFKDGELTVALGETEVAPFTNYMATYNAYPKGSEALVNAQDVFNREMEAINGKRSASERRRPVVGNKPTVHGAPGAEGNPGSVGGGDAGGEAIPPAGGLVPEGGGDEAGRMAPKLPQAEVRLHNIIRAMDPENDEHWTQAGLPRLSVIEEALGSTDVTREDINKAVPGWNRDAAKAEKVKEVPGPAPQASDDDLNDLF